MSDSNIAMVARAMCEAAGEDPDEKINELGPAWMAYRAEAELFILMKDGSDRWRRRVRTATS